MTSHDELEGRTAAMISSSRRDLVDETQRLGADVVALTDAACHVALGWRALLRHQLERQPYATLAVASGVGYVLGGGMPRAALRMLIDVGGRLAVGHVIARLVADPIEDGYPGERRR